MKIKKQIAPGMFNIIEEPDCAYFVQEQVGQSPCSSCREGTSLKLFGCKLHERCTPETKLDKIKCCKTCHDNTLRTKIITKKQLAPGIYNNIELSVNKPILQVESNSPGIGDNLLTLTIAEGMRKQWPEVAMLCQTWVMDWLMLFKGPHVIDQRLKMPTCFCSVNSDTSKLIRTIGKSRVELWAEQYGTKPVIPEHIPLNYNRNLMGRIVLVPYAQHQNRTWPQFIELEKRLIELGFRCVIIGNKPLNGFQSETWVNRTPNDIAELMYGATCVIGNDSGMSHLAGMLKVPTIAICSKASDPNIFGIYSTVKQITNPTIDQVINLLPNDFKLKGLENVVLDRDKWRLTCWYFVYDQLYKLVKRLNPKKIGEIGTRAGYSSWAMLQACPNATIDGYDLDSDLHGGFTGAHLHARKILGNKLKLTIGNSHDIKILPKYDFMYVDGDHSYEGCLADMKLVERSGITTMAVDDVANISDIGKAIDQMVGWKVTYIPSDTGLALLEKI